MSHIFLSYSRNDDGPAKSIVGGLQRAGFTVWMDVEGIGGGRQWRNQIVQAIAEAGVLIVLMSPNSMRSSNVRKEIDLAEEAGVRILPVEINPVDVPDALKFQLAGIQIVDVWRDSQAGHAKLVAALDQIGIRRVQAVASSSSSRQSPKNNDRRSKAARGNVDLSELGGASFLDKLSLKGWFAKR